MKYPCLNSYEERCCKLQGDKVVNDHHKTSNKDESCEAHFNLLKLTDYCTMREPNTLFKFIENSHEYFFEDFKVSELHIQDSEIRNFFYNMNSMVNITQFGAQITFENTVFDRINICGALINNKYIPNNNADISSISDDLLD